jgi:hypothetical protein
MNIEKPRSPGHCLGMLNAHMRTDILRGVHEGMFARKDQRDRGVHKKSPLEMLIESIEEVLAAFGDTNLIASVGPNPFNCDPRHYRFQQTRDYHHDITLLKSQLAGLREILAEIDMWD